MTVPWIHLVGLYLLIGTMMSGLALVAKLRMAGYTKPIFPNRRAMIWFGVGVAVGVLLWPAILLLVPIIRKVIRHRLRSRGKS